SHASSIDSKSFCAKTCGDLLRGGSILRRWYWCSKAGGRKEGGILLHVVHPRVLADRHSGAFRHLCSKPFNEDCPEAAIRLVSTFYRYAVLIHKLLGDGLNFFTGNVFSENNDVLARDNGSRSPNYLKPVHKSAEPLECGWLGAA